MAASVSNSSQTATRPWGRLLILVLALIFLYVLLPQIKSLSPSIHSLTHAHASYVLAGVAVTASTFFVAAIMYQLLCKHSLHYGRTLLVQAASGFANRLLPAGLGGMGLIAQYLRTQKHSGTEAVTVVGMDNTIGIIGHFLLFFIVIATTNVSFSQLHLPHLAAPLYIALAIVAILAINLIVFRRFRAALTRNLGHIVHDALGYRGHPVRLALALCNSLLLTILYTVILWCSARALGADLSIAKVLVVFTAGSVVGNATPTPGGLIGTEAGLFGGFVAYSVSDSTALAIALLYRLLTYWLPILPGIVAFSFAQRRLHLIGR
jgi:glycosyltransferase 2 family protein